MISWCRGRFWFCGAFLLAIIVATIVIMPRVDDLRLNQDFPLYSSAAHRLIDGDILMSEFGRNAPGWPVYLGFLYLVFGSSDLVLAVSQIVLHVCLVVVTYHLAKEISNDERVQYLAMCISAVWPAFLFQLRHGSSALLYAVIFLSATFFLVRSVRMQSISRAIIGGLLLGFGALIDVVALFLPCLFFLWALIEAFRSRRIPSACMKRVAIAFIVCATAIFVIVPWTYRNILLFKDFSVAPIIAKGEQNYFKPENIKKIGHVFVPDGEPLLTESLMRTFVFPAGIHALDSTAPFSYKERFLDILYGVKSFTDFSSREITILSIKIFITIIHLAVLIGALITMARRYSNDIAILTSLLVVYIFIAITATVALSSFESITLANGFLIPLTPLLIIFALEGYLSRIRANGKFSLRDII